MFQLSGRKICTYAHHTHYTMQMLIMPSAQKICEMMPVHAALASAASLQADSLSAAELEPAGAPGVKKVSNCA